MIRKVSGIKRKLTWSLGGNIAYAISQWIIVSIIARYGTAEDLGIYSIGLAVTAPIVLFFSFQLRTILATDIKNQFSFNQYFGGRLVHLTISYIVIIPVAFFYSNNSSSFIIILLMGLVKYVEALSDVCMGFFQKHSRIDLIGKSQLGRGIVSVVVVGLLYISTQNITISIFGLLIVMLLRLFFFDMKYLKAYVKIQPVFDESSFLLIKLGLPLGISSLISSLNTNIPRYYLDHLYGVEYVGVFSALYYVLIASNMLITPISLLAAPKIASVYNKKNIKDFIFINIKLFSFSICIFLLVFIPIYLQGGNILKILYGEGYSIYEESFVLISLSLLFGFLIAFLELSIVSARRLRIQPIINLITVIITSIIGYKLIALYGINGAAITVLISRIIQCILSIIVFLLILTQRNMHNDYKNQ